MLMLLASGCGTVSGSGAQLTGNDPVCDGLQATVDKLVRTVVNDPGVSNATLADTENLQVKFKAACTSGNRKSVYDQRDAGRRKDRKKPWWKNILP